MSDSRTSTIGAASPSTGSPDEILSNLGMDVRDLSSSEQIRLPKDGVLVDAISPGSKIARANMEEKFIITRINGVPVKNISDFKSELKRAGTALYLQGYYEDYPGDFAYSLALK